MRWIYKYYFLEEHEQADITASAQKRKIGFDNVNACLTSVANRHRTTLLMLIYILKLNHALHLYYALARASFFTIHYEMYDYS